MAIILFDDNAHHTLRPLTFTRPVADLRLGIFTIAEKWGKYFDLGYSFHTQRWLQGKFPIRLEEGNLFINGAFCPDEPLIAPIISLHGDEALMYQGRLVAVKLNERDASDFDAACEFEH